MPDDVLGPILRDVRQRLAERKRLFPLSEITRWARFRTPPDFAGAIRGRQRLSVIAEIKRSSPSSPDLAPQLDPARMARRYESAGAAAISVLTEEDHFSGSLRDLLTVSLRCGLPVLRKDFTIDEYQIYEARAYGAAAVLLIVRILPVARLRQFLRVAGRLGLAALVEVHDERELDTALSAGARIIGVNNRNLSTLKTDLKIARRLLPLIPKSCVRVAESGYSRPEGLRELKGVADATLIGTAFLKDPGKIRKLLGPARRG